MSAGRDRRQPIPSTASATPPVASLDEPVGPSVLDELMTARQVASFFQMKVSTVEDYARRGILPSVKVGRHRRFIRSHLEQALGALTNSQPS
jgi:excisionase family DNA binding protein